MLSPTLLVIYLKLTFIVCSDVGTAIFHKQHGVSDCWSQEEVAKLRARKMFQHMMPSPVTPSKTNKRFIKDTLRYYRNAMKTAGANTDNHTSAVLKEALADTIGGHLRSQMLPTVRLAYYAGYVPYRQARQLHDFFESIKTLLNTKGIGWAEPATVPPWSNLTVLKILIGPGKLFDPCGSLVLKRDSNSCIHLPTPRLDDNHNPTAIALPFKTDGFVSLSSPQSENILLKYYTTASRCILRSSPTNCRHSDFVNFNNDLWHWMKRDVAPHLMDENLYVAYGGVLRIAAAVQSYGKGLSRRNLFEYQDAGVSKWHPWQALTHSYVNIDADWTPKLYVGIVLLAALAICLMQICYNYIFGDATGCQCTGSPKKMISKGVAYATVDTFPSMLTSPYSGEKCRQKYSTTRTRSSLASVKTQRVYDLNENAEKFMEVILSGNEDSELETPTFSRQESDADNVINLGQSKTSKSPPELHTPIAQLRIEKPCQEKSSTQMYTTSTETNSDMTCCQEQHASETMWSETGTTTSGRSVSTDSSKTPSRRTRRSRDIAWARRVASKHTLHSNTRTTGTEFDVGSFTTPPRR